MTESHPNLPDQLQSRFGDVCALSAELSMVASFEDLCRQAVVRGREVLGLDRIGLWFQTQTPLVVEGSFGTDESGAIRDERGLRLRCAPGSAMGRLLAEGKPTVFVDDAPTARPPRRSRGPRLPSPRIAVGWREDYRVPLGGRFAPRTSNYGIRT